MHEHPDQRPPLALATVPAAARGLRRQARRLQHQPGPGVRELEPVLLGRLLPEVLDGEVGITLAPQPTQPRDHRDGNPPAARRDPALVLQPVVAAPLPCLLEPAQMPRGDLEDVRGLNPGQLPVDGLHDHVSAGHRPDLLRHQPPHVLHGAAVAVRADIFECLWGGHLQCVPQGERPRIDSAQRAGLPDRMRSVWIPKAGPPEVLEVRDGPDPVPRAGEVLIRVRASGVNFADVSARLGFYPDAPPFPCVVGYEVAGRRRAGAGRQRA